MENIIFLDVDGVLNSDGYYDSLKDVPLKERDEFDEIGDYHLQMLAKIYHTCNAKIVLSSSWRTLYDEKNPNDTPMKMHQYLIDSLLKYDMQVVDHTPIVACNRPLEILIWLENHGGKENYNFVSLDDDFSKEDYEAYGIGDCLIHTIFFTHDMSKGGLQQEHVDLAIKKLKGI